MMNRYTCRQTLAFALLALASTSRSAAAQEPVFSPEDDPYGLSYGEWAAAWWTWALTQPASTNPVLDPTGEFCDEEQEGSVWFLAGLFGSGTVTRSCTVPADTALLFPVINQFYCAEPDDQPAQQTEEYVRNRLRFVPGAARDLYATIDGEPVLDIEGRYFEQSALFEIVLPEDNIFGAPELAGLEFEPCADAGYYLVVQPLSSGMHTIEFGGSLRGASIDVTYHITVSE